MSFLTHCKHGAPLGAPCLECDRAKARASVPYVLQPLWLSGFACGWVAHMVLHWSTP